MPFFEKLVSELGESDINELIGVTERIDLEFKATLPKPGTDRDEFISDVSSFANAQGGRIVYGVVADATETAISVDGISDVNLSNEIMRLRNWLNSNVDPRIPGIEFQEVRLASLQSKSALVIQIPPPSYAAPHQNRGIFRFMKRYPPSKKEAMTTLEVKNMFIQSQVLVDRGRSTIIDRVRVLEQVHNDEIPCSLTDSPRIILHTIPLVQQPSDFNARFKAFMDRDRENAFYFPDSTGSATGPTLDGWLYEILANRPNPEGYIQVNRNGTIEALRTRDIRTVENNRKCLLASQIEVDLITLAHASLISYSALGLTPPLAIVLSLVRMDDLFFADPAANGFIRFSTTKRRAKYIFPELMVDSLPPNIRLVDVPKIMRPVCDWLFNAAGWHESTGFDAAGEWARKWR